MAFSLFKGGNMSFQPVVFVYSYLLNFSPHFKNNQAQSLAFGTIPNVRERCAPPPVNNERSFKESLVVRDVHGCYCNETKITSETDIFI